MQRSGAWFVNQWPPSRKAPQRIISAEFVDTMLGNHNDVDLRVSTHPWKHMDGVIWRNAKTHEPYSYTFADTDRTVYIGRRFLDLFGSQNRRELFIGLRAIHRIVAYPPFGSMPLARWYEGVCEILFIALHPFTKSPYKQGGSKDFTWATLVTELALPDTASIADFLSAAYGVYDTPAGQKLHEHAFMQDEIYPVAGEFGYTMLERILTVLDVLHIDQVAITNMATLQDEAISVAALRVRLDSRKKKHIQQISRITAIDNSLTIGVGRGRPFSIIAGTAQRLRAIRLDAFFEGFYASDETCENWWLSTEARNAQRKQQVKDGYRYLGHRALEPYAD